ncbi:branched-chain amino acid ABC transporter permease [Rhodobacteraceae bacterium LMO-12]|nr:branched-chain amino acid ABC transporter permease [Rhodobacteraceae bacterium LMO-JJ12]
MDLSILSSVPQFMAGGLAIGAIYGLVAAGFSLIYNSSKVINFSQGEFVVIGGLSAVTFLSLPIPTWLALSLSLIVSVILGLLLRFILGMARKDSTEMTFIMITLGLAMVITGLAYQIWGADFLSFQLFPRESYNVLGATLNFDTITILAITCIVCVIMWFFLYRTIFGKAMRAVSENARVAQTVGVNPGTMIMVAFAFSAFLGGLAGILITPSQMMSYDNGVILVVKGFAAAIVGGLVNPFGAVVGGILVGVIEGLCVGLISSELQNVYAFVVLFVVLLVRPQGLLGKVTQGLSR